MSQPPNPKKASTFGEIYNCYCPDNRCVPHLISATTLVKVHANTHPKCNKPLRRVPINQEYFDPDDDYFPERYGGKFSIWTGQNYHEYQDREKVEREFEAQRRKVAEWKKVYADLKEKVPGWKAERKDAPIEIEDPRKVDKPKEDDNVQEIEDPRKVDKPQEVEDPGKFYDSQEDMPEFLYSKKAEKVKAKSKYEIEIEQEFENQRRKQLEWEKEYTEKKKALKEFEETGGYL